MPPMTKKSIGLHSNKLGMLVKFVDRSTKPLLGFNLLLAVVMSVLQLLMFY